ncbi:Na(+)/H(+) antiporter subunit C [Ornithinibacillus halotolerans]|uniref:Na(+)/H(+) antiporter subunit C n=1 Tax=Ornithinibacillus halotolerans TaxID=1274357 RepID=A0A916W6Q7_9BACI|nr:Na(+)/H(+) antiporter subunit C [Ornithinibacillus halotolerans]GGA72749.1 Na(+)/H(+) antiporter subunit C [Ornithinibacillus halotolerans]
MESLMAIVIGILFSIGTYLILSNQMLRIILGLSLISHAINIMIIVMGGLKTGGPPLLSNSDRGFTDAVPQALILTAIVINFAVTAFLLVLSYRTYKKHGTDDMNNLRGNEHE